MLLILLFVEGVYRGRYRWWLLVMTIDALKVDENEPVNVLSRLRVVCIINDSRKSCFWTLGGGARREVAASR